MVNTLDAVVLRRVRGPGNRGRCGPDPAGAAAAVVVTTCGAYPRRVVHALECHLAFVYWNRQQRRYCPLPDGVEVLARDADPVSPDDTLGVGTIAGGQGQVHIVVTDRDEDRPEVYFEIRFGEAAIDLASGRLTTSRTVATLALPEVWTTRNRFDLAYTRGLWDSFVGNAIGQPDAPVRFRVSLDAFVRFVRWDEQRGEFLGVPEGTAVSLVEHGTFTSTTLARDTLDDHGRALLSVTADHEHRPDLSLEVSLPEGTWDSREHFAQGSLVQRGYWDEYVGTRIGRWGSPYTFDLSGPQPRRIPGNTVRALIDGPAIYGAMRDGIQGAQRSIHAEVMLFYDDRYGRKIRDLLVARARDGVEVRLMFDVQTTARSHSLATLKEIWARTARRLSAAERDQLLAALAVEREAERVRGNTEALRASLQAEPNITLLDSSFPYVEVAPRDEVADAPPAYQQLRQQLPFFSVARIDHRKLMVFDGRRAVVGGANVGQEYLYEQPFDPTVPAETEEWVKWHDCFIDVSGPAVAAVQARFRERWVAEGGDAFDLGAAAGADARPDHPYFPALDAQPGGASVSLLDTTPGARMHIHEQLLALMSQAKREILVENPYFSSREVLRSLCDAARRGVRVVCIFPDDHNDSWDFLYAARLKYPELIEAGAQVHEYRNHMTHAKVAVIDDVAIIGSANLNHASFFNHYELAVVVHDAEFARSFRRDMFERDLVHADRIWAGDVEGLLDIEDWVRPYLRHVVDGWF